MDVGNAGRVERAGAGKGDDQDNREIWNLVASARQRIIMEADVRSLPAVLLPVTR